MAQRIQLFCYLLGGHVRMAAAYRLLNHADDRRGNQFLRGFRQAPQLTARL